MIRAVYWVKRHLRGAIRSACGGEIPDWLSDTYAALAYVDFVNLFPTLLAIFIVPEHFFRRIDLLTRRRKVGVRESLYKTPVQLVTTVVTLLLAAKWINAYLPSGELRIALFGLLIFLPIIISVFCMALWVVGQVAFYVTTHGVPALLFLGLVPKRYRLWLTMGFRQGFDT